jgi:hypothetical protein
MAMINPPTIDLSTCKPGDRVRLRDGRRGIYKRFTSSYHEVRVRHHNAGWYIYGFYTRDGHSALFTPAERHDIVAILGPSLIERVRRALGRRKHGA